jgi:hypothetical protein
MSTQNPTMVSVEIPDVPEGIHPSAAWRKTVTGLDENERKGRMVQGEFVAVGTRVELAAGTLVLAVDKHTVNWTLDRYRTREVPVHAPTLTLYRVQDGAPGGLAEVWRRSYKTMGGAWGATTRKQLRAALAELPEPAAQAPVVAATDRRGRNGRRVDCHWCGQPIERGRGWLAGWHENVRYEHDDDACPTRPARDGTPCELCGVSVLAREAHQVAVRGGQPSTWSTRHQPRLECTTTLVRSFEEYRAEVARQAERNRAEREARRVQEEKRQARLAKDRARRAAKKKEQQEAEAAARAAEAERIKHLDVVRTERTEVTSKQLGWGRGSARLFEVTLHLSDGTTATRWDVEVSASGGGWVGGDYDDVDVSDEDTGRFTDKEQAWDAYRRHKFVKPSDRRRPTWGGRSRSKAGTSARVEVAEGTPTMQVARGSGGQSEVEADAYEVGVAERLSWHPATTGALTAEQVPGGCTDRLGRTTGIVVPVETGYRYYDEDGMSFGVGADEGYVYTAIVRPATAEEAAPILAEEEAVRHRREVAARKDALLSWRGPDEAKGAVCPRPITGPSPAGAEVVPHEAPPLYYSGVRDELRVDRANQLVWALSYNGRDGDTWDASNWRSFIAIHHPLTPEREALIAELTALYGPAAT